MGTKTIFLIFRYLLGALLLFRRVSAKAEPERVFFHKCRGREQTFRRDFFETTSFRMDVPVRTAKSFRLHIEGKFLRNYIHPSNESKGDTCNDYLTRVTLAKAGLEYKSGEKSLCDQLHMNESSPLSIHNGKRITIRTSVQVPWNLEADIYQCYFEILPKSSSNLRACKVPVNDSLACVHADQVVRTGISDYLSAIVAFGVAAAASWHLGKAVQFLRLPLITGYLFIGIIVGPYVTDLVDNFYIYLLGPYLNDLALSFISFAAGEEIFFPSLSKLMVPILAQTAMISLCTSVLITAGMMLASSLETFTDGKELACHIAISLLVSIIMIARSPASAVAILQEVGAQVDPLSSKLLMGVTVMSDVVVLLGFAIVIALVGAICPPDETKHVKDTSTITEITLIVSQYIVIVLLGGIVGKCLVGIMSIPFQRMKIRTFTVYRSYMKGALIIPFGFLVFQFLRFIAYQSENALGKPFNIEPLMVCMIGASFASHRSDRREKFANILEKSSPYVFLPFFTLTGASLDLTAVLESLPLACTICLLRILSTFVGSMIAGKYFSGVEHEKLKYIWLTLLSQAGVALGLALEVDSRFPSWGRDFKTLILSIVVMNQIVGPPLCKYGLYLLGTGVDSEVREELIRREEMEPINVSPYIRSDRSLRRHLTTDNVSNERFYTPPASAYHFTSRIDSMGGS